MIVIDASIAVKLVLPHEEGYDMLYAVVAKHQKMMLITADAQFAKQTKFKFVKLLNGDS